MNADQTQLARLEQSMGRVMRGSRRHMAGRSGRLEGAGYIVLTSLERCEPARMSELAALLRLDASTVSRQLRGLEEAGLIRREPDPDDRRATRVRISDQGWEELTLQRRERHAVLAAAMADWDAADRARLTELLERLAEAVEAAQPPGAPTARPLDTAATDRSPLTVSLTPMTREAAAR